MKRSSGFFDKNGKEIFLGDTIRVMVGETKLSPRIDPTLSEILQGRLFSVEITPVPKDSKVQIAGGEFVAVRAGDDGKAYDLLSDIACFSEVV